MKHTNFEQAVITQAIDKLFNGTKHFDICQLDAIARLLGTNPDAHPQYKYLRALHCVNYGDMLPEVRDGLAMRVLDVLRPGAGVNAASFAAALCAEGRDFAHTEDRYIEGTVLQLGRKR